MMTPAQTPPPTPQNASAPAATADRPGAGTHERPPAVLMIGLGRMGGNMARRLAAGGVLVHGYDVGTVDPAVVQSGVHLHTDLAEAVAALPAQHTRVVWMMLPHGPVTDSTIGALQSLLRAGDLIVDGGNAHYLATQARARHLASAGLNFADCGVSGGVWGLANGYCLMFGGDADAASRIEPLAQVLAPTPTTGWLHTGPVGSGHFTKMIHNGIEYGMMQALSEGFALMQAKTEFGLPLADIAELWRHGSVVRSWLLDLSADALQAPGALDSVEPVVADSGEGRWTIEEALRLGVPAPVTALALMSRFDSQGGADVGNKLLALMRKGFGGHAVVAHAAPGASGPAAGAQSKE